MKREDVEEEDRCRCALCHLHAHSQDRIEDEDLRMYDDYGKGKQFISGGGV